MKTQCSDAEAISSQLTAMIQAEIEHTKANTGVPMPFSRFHMLAQYAPGLGYYSAGAHKFGAQGDFITAPELGSLYAQTIARAIAPVFAELDDATLFELGGGSGAFAADVLEALQRMDALPAHYWLLEPSADLRERQQALLQERGLLNLCDVRWLDAPPEQPWQGVLFANEVIDALPVTRFAIRDGEVFEEHIDCADDGLCAVDRPADVLVTQTVRHLERCLGEALPDGYRSEVLPQLPYWMQAVTASMQRGLALFVDYGYDRRTFYSHERNQGTLVCFHQHQASFDPLQRIGLQDITAFVDFTALAEAGQHAGFELAGYASQSGFLLQHGLLDVVEAEQQVDDSVEATLARSAQVKRLTLPGEMGEKFAVMGLVKDMPADGLFGMGERSNRL